MESQRQLSTAIALQFVAMLLVHGSMYFLHRAHTDPSESELALQVSTLTGAAVVLLVSPALLLLGRVFFGGGAREKMYAVIASALALVQLVVGAIALWDGIVYFADKAAG